MIPMIKIREACEDDLSCLDKIFETARSRMRKCGNATQWTGGYPSRQILLGDILSRQGFVLEKAGIPVGYFCLQREPEPSYAFIEDGEWPDNNPYLTIHRAAAARDGMGLFGIIINYATGFGLPVRADTHADNYIMRHLLVRYGFSYCGMITLADGTLRRAYHHPNLYKTDGMVPV